jgi:hypothetical protein
MRGIRMDHKANILEGSRTNEVELIEIIADTETRQNHKQIMCLLVERSRNCI